MGESGSIDWVIGVITDELEAHRRVGAACECGWHTVPMLDMGHRRHQAQAIASMTIAAVSQANGAAIAAARRNDAIRIEALERQLDDCRTHVMTHPESRSAS